MFRRYLFGNIKHDFDEVSSQLGNVVCVSELDTLLPHLLCKCVPSARNVTLLWNDSLQQHLDSLNVILKVDIAKVIAPPFGCKLFHVSSMELNAVSRCLHWEETSSLLARSPSPTSTLTTHNGKRKEKSCDRRGVLIMAFHSNRDTNHLKALILMSCSTTLKENESDLSFYQKQIAVVLQRMERIQTLNTPTVAANHNPADTTHLPPQLAQNLLNLCGSLFDQKSGELQLKVLQFLVQHTHAETGCLLMYNADSAELTNEVYGNCIRDEAWREQIQGSKFHELLESKNTICQNIISEDWVSEVSSVMESEIDRIRHHSFLCVPLVSRATQQVIAFACLFNASDNTGFTKRDEEVLKTCFHYTSSVLTSTIAFQKEQRLKKQTERMLQVAKNIFSRMDNMKMLLLEIMREARNLTQAERCSVFILDNENNELVAKVFDGVATTAANEHQVDQEKLVLEDGTEVEAREEVRIPSTQGIAGHVATTGEMLNIKDAYAHPLFYRKVDEDTGFKTRNILCFPIVNNQGSVVGVAQLCNKMKAAHFTRVDEEIAAVFAIYCGISIVHSLMFEKIEDAQQRIRLTTELMTYHMQVSDEAAMRLSLCQIPALASFIPDPTSFEAIPRSVPESEGALATISMFEELGLLQRWRIHRRTLARFVLRVKRGYRDPPYHNWTHAFSVAHFIFLCLKNLPLVSQNQLSELEALGLFVASLCHDIDHRGTNNLFQLESKSTLAALYSSEGSVLERHHLAQSMCILNTAGCNVFEHLSQQEYSKVLDHMRDCILATDLAHHLKIMPELQQLASSGQPLEPRNARHHYLLICLLMTSADLSDQTKNWKNTRAVAELIYKEFFSQGDLEKMLGQKPQEQMDRERACVPELQVSFLDTIALPLYRILAALYPQCQALVHTIEKNKTHWMQIYALVKSGKITGNSEEIFKVQWIDDEDIPLER